MQGVAITNSSNGFANVLVSKIEIKAHGNPKGTKTVGIWDTGASRSAITKSTAAKLGLKPIGIAMVQVAHGDKPVPRNVYLIDLVIENAMNIEKGRVTECDELTGDQAVGMLIGMDVITVGDFAVTNFKGKTCMTFRIPSMQKLDFVKYPNPKSAGAAPVKKVGRNEPCFCGSGKKYKKCCLK